MEAGMNRSADLPTCMSEEEEDEEKCIEQALTYLSRLEAMCEAVQAQQRSQELFESRFLLMEAKENSNCAHNAQLQTQLVTTVSRLKNTTKECNAQLQSIVELQKAVNEGEDKNAELRRELEEKTVELAKEEKRRKREVDEIISSSKEEMGKAIEKLRQDNELRIKSLEEQHSKKQMQLKSQYEEKMILFSTSSASRAPTCTVSESQLRQSLIEAKEEIQALKEQKNQMESRMASLHLQAKAPAAPAAPVRKAPGNYIISSESDDEDIFTSHPQASGERVPAKGPQKKARVAEKGQKSASSSSAGKKVDGRTQQGKAQKASSKTQTTLRRDDGSGKAKASLQFETSSRSPFDYFD